MVDEIKDRSDLLNAIKSAEKAGAEMEDGARAKASGIRAITQTECTKIIEKAEMDGRAAMRHAIEAAKAECQSVRDSLVKETVRKGQVQEHNSKARIPAIADMMFIKFKKEYDVKD